MTINGDADGNTAGTAWNPGQKYGRWEGRVRAPVDGSRWWMTTNVDILPPGPMHLCIQLDWLRTMAAP